VRIHAPGIDNAQTVLTNEAFLREMAFTSREVNARRAINDKCAEYSALARDLIAAARDLAGAARDPLLWGLQPASTRTRATPQKSQKPAGGKTRF
jgi:hypothetical protein